jgi:hypothetical protein
MFPGIDDTKRWNQEASSRPGAGTEVEISVAGEVATEECGDEVQ